MLILFLSLVAVIVGIGIAWQYYTSKDELASPIKQEPTESKEEEVGNEQETKVEKEQVVDETVKSLLQVLEDIGCSKLLNDYGHSISFTYRDLSFSVDSKHCERFIQINISDCGSFNGDGYIFDGIDKAFAEINKDYFPSYNYIWFDESGEMFIVEGRGTIYFGEMIPNLKEYLQNALDRFVESHNELLKSLQNNGMDFTKRDKENT